MNTTDKSLIQAKKDYAANKAAKYVAQGLVSPVIVLPEFVQDEHNNWVPGDDVVIASGGDKGFGYIQIIQDRIVDAKGVEFNTTMWAIQRGKVDSLALKYNAGQVLPGNIVIEESLTPPNASNPAQGVKYRSESLQEAGIHCSVKGEPVYQIKYWDKTGTVTDTRIEHDNQAEIDQHNAAVLALANKSTGIQSAAAAKRKQLAGK